MAKSSSVNKENANPPIIGMRREPKDLASLLRWRVDILEHDQTGAWVTVAHRVPAAMSALQRGRPFSGGHELELFYPQQYVEIALRYRPGQRIYPRSRIVFSTSQGTRTFDVQAVGIPDERRRTIILSCVETQDVGPVH